MSPIFSVNPTPLISVSHCFGIHMAQPMKEKIMQVKGYIDLSNIIKPDPYPNKTDQHKFAILITSLEAWTDAFIVFASSYLTRHPADIQDILKYMQKIKLVLDQGQVEIPMQVGSIMTAVLFKNTG